MAPTVPSAAQRRCLQQLLVDYPRQRSFEKQAREHQSLKNLPLKTITAWYTEQERRKTTSDNPASTTRARPAPRPLVIPRRGASAISGSATAGEQQHSTDVKMETPPPTPITPSNHRVDGQVVRPSPVRSSPEKYSPTTLSLPETSRDDVVAALELIVEQKEPVVAHAGCEECLNLKPEFVVIGAWKREHKSQAPLTVSVECSGAIEIATRQGDTLYRLRIPLTQLAHISLQSSVLSLNLLLPPEFYQRPISTPGEPKLRWKPCSDFTPNQEATSNSALTIHFEPNHHSTTELADNALLKPLTIVLPPTPTDASSTPSTFDPLPISASALATTPSSSANAGAPTSRLFLSVHSQAVAQRTAFLQANHLQSQHSPFQAPLVYAIPHQCACPSSPPSPSPIRHSTSSPRKLAIVSPEQEEKEFAAWYDTTGGRAEAISAMEVDEMWSPVMDERMGLA